MNKHKIILHQQMIKFNNKYYAKMKLKIVIINLYRLKKLLNVLMGKKIVLIIIKH